jgi:hypothetical protein
VESYRSERGPRQRVVACLGRLGVKRTAEDRAKSGQRKLFEQAMHARFEKRIEDGLEQIARGCASRRYKPVTIARRVGRLLERNSRAAGLFQIDVIEQSPDWRATVVWKEVGLVERAGRRSTSPRPSAHAPPRQT